MANNYYVIHNIDCLMDFYNVIDSITSNSRNNLWFRGVGNANYQLTPSIMRNTHVHDTASMSEMERKLLTRFKERSIPYLNERMDDEWELLFLMQHYGTPTRFLDWTENPMIAIFFALSSAKKDHLGVYSDAAVWVLDPTLWNKTVFHHLSWNDGPMSVSYPAINNGYKPSGINHRGAAAIHGTHNSPRIVAQRGSFTILGTDVNSLDDQYHNEALFAKETLIKICISKDSIKEMLKRLVGMGVTDATVYPDLSGLCMEIKRTYEYEV